MSRSTTTTARILATMTTVGVGLAGLGVISVPAQAVEVTTFGLQATAYATKVEGGDLPVTSGRSAFSYLSCTRRVGVTRGNEVASATLGGVAVAGAASRNRTWKKDGEVHVASTNTLASVTLREATGAGTLVIESLTTKAHAWHGPDGYHATTSTAGVLVVTAGSAPIDTNISSVPVDLSPGETIRVPLPREGQYLSLPGVGHVSADWTTNRAGTDFAQASVKGLRVQLPATESTIVVGRARAAVNGAMTAGVLGGRAYGSELSASDGQLHSGRTALKPLPCRGTGGRWRSTSTAGVNLVGVGSIGATESSVYGRHNADRSGVAATRSTVTQVTLADGAFVLRGINAQATARRSTTGEVTTSAEGTSPGTLTAGGVTLPLAADGVISLGTLGTIETGLTTATRSGVKVIAVRVTLFNGTEADTVLDLGNAAASIA